MHLTQEQLAKFSEEGYLIIPDFLSSEEVTLLHNQCVSLCHNQEKIQEALKHQVVFKSTSKNEALREMLNYKPETETDPNKFFLDSSDQVSYFFEEKAFDENGNINVPLNVAFNKIGHALHVDDPIFSEFTKSDKVKELMKSLHFIDPILLQSMLIYKNPRIGGKVDVHRDNTFLYTSPLSTIGFWIALEDCDTLNGCLRFVPKSHKDNLCDKRMLRVYSDEDNNNNNFDHNNNVKLEFNGSERSDYKPEDYVIGEVKKGTLVLIHGDIVHMSTENKSERSRNIYTFHCIESYNHHYLKENWLQWFNKNNNNDNHNDNNDNTNNNNNNNNGTKYMPRLFSEQEKNEQINKYHANGDKKTFIY